MSNKALDNLVKIGQLKAEPFSQSEFDTYMRSGKERLQDAASPGISQSGKFLLGYAAAYSFSLTALRDLVIGRLTATSYFNVCLTPWV
ncbi:hypothetical protein [Collimonas fungivorans]|uniref:hypothetical protein n=1 Tax=Collimonas fungivorans TaxID=158899 RepID=UPI003FA3D05A